MSKHTPGPWMAEGCRNNAVVVWAPKAPSELSVAVSVGPVSSYWGDRNKPPTSDAVVEANARLIAAAPDLLAALEGTAKWLHSGHGPFAMAQCGLCKPILAAIAKAVSK